MMEWWALAAIYFGGLILFFALGVHVAIAFAIMNIVMIFFFVGEVGAGPFLMIATSAFRSVSSFTFIAVPFFIFLGELALRTGLATLAIDAIRAAMRGGARGLLYYVAVVVSTMFGAISGSSMASTATIGAVMVPDALKLGYNKSFFTGIICGGGALAVLIPPSILMIVFAGLSGLSPGRMLIGGILPGLVIAALFTVFMAIIIRLKPGVAPAQEEVAYYPMKRRITGLIKHVLPLGAILVTVILVIYLGIGTPTEAAAGGAFTTLLLAIAYRKLSWPVLKASAFSTLTTTSMIFFIVANSMAFSQILAITGISTGATEVIVGLPLSPLMLLSIMLLGLIVLGFFMDQISIMFITIPLYFPIAATFGWNPLWFGIICMIAIGLGVLTPPFGLNLFVMKGVAPPEVTLGDIIKGSIPFATLHAVGLFLVVAFPAIALFLPTLMV